MSNTNEAQWNATKVIIDGIGMTNEDAQKIRVMLKDNIDTVAAVALRSGDITPAQEYDFRKAIQVLHSLKEAEKANGALSATQLATLTATEQSHVGKVVNKLIGQTYTAQPKPAPQPTSQPTPSRPAKPKMTVGGVSRSLLRTALMSTVSVAALGTNIGLPLYLAVKLGSKMFPGKSAGGVKQPFNGGRAAAVALATLFSMVAAPAVVNTIFKPKNPNLNFALHYGVLGHIGNAVTQAAYDDYKHSHGNKKSPEFTESFLRRIWVRGSDTVVATASVAADIAVGTADVAVSGATAARNGLAKIADPENKDLQEGASPSVAPTPQASNKVGPALAAAGKTILVCLDLSDASEFRKAASGDFRWFPKADAHTPENLAKQRAFFDHVNKVAENLKASPNSALNQALSQAARATLIVPGYKSGQDPEITSDQKCPDAKYLPLSGRADDWINGFGYKASLNTGYTIK